MSVNFCARIPKTVPISKVPAGINICFFICNPLVFNFIPPLFILSITIASTSVFDVFCCFVKEILGGPRAQQASQVSPKARTTAEIEAGVPEGQFEFAAIGDKMELAGPLMVPDKLIPRYDDEGEKYYVFFDAAGIKKLSYKLMENKLIDSVNIEHDPDRKVADLTLVESWLVADEKNDKSNSYGYDLPKGSWFGVYKVNNEEVWDKYIKTGAVKGFSVEGIFNDKTILANKQEYAFTKS